jgi:hypothetical protein
VKPIGRVGLAIVTALSALALLGVSPAAAEPTALCMVDEGEVCEAGDQVSHVHYEAKGVKFLSIIVNSECKSSLILTDAVNINELLGSPLKFEVPFNAKTTLEDLTFKECSEGCEIKQTKRFELDYLRTVAETATVTGLEFGIKVECDEPPLECFYAAKSLAGQARGPLLTGDNGHLTFSEAVLKEASESGPMCPDEAKLDALYVVLPKPIYIKE